MKTGLVMEGGAMKGLFTCGILDVFMENGITFDYAAGVSAGAVFGCNYKSGQIGRPLRYNKRFSGDKRYASLRNFFRTGDLYDVDFCYRRIPYELDIWDAEAFRKNPLKFYTVSTSMETGKGAYHLCGEGGEEDLQWMRSSASVPVISRIVEIDGKGYLDGGIGDPIPLRFMESLGCDRIIVIPTKPYGYVRKGHPLQNLAQRILYRKYPEYVKSAVSLPQRYNETNSYVQSREDKGEIIVLRPTELLTLSGIPKDPDELQRVYDMGRKVALDNLERIRKYLSE